jgi:Domain of unknown function (DUF4276)
VTPRIVTIASIVEGHGKVSAMPKLLHRLAADLPTVDLRTPKPPWRRPRGSLIAPNGIEREVESNSWVGLSGGILVVLDADDDCPAKLAPALLQRARSARPDMRISVVLAKREFEAWFLASAPSLAGHFGFPDEMRAPSDPEAVRDAKGWLSRHRSGGHPYKETVDQAALTSVFDIKQAREHAESFDKFCREIEELLGPPASPC